MTLVSIEGNIGAGKSTLIETLKTKFTKTVVFVDEPVDEWSTVRDSSGVTILEKYYSDQKRYAFAFQMMAFITRVKRLREAIAKYPNAVIVTERSVFTDREIFAKMLHDENKIEDIEYTIYLKWFDELVGDIRVDGIIYVKTPPVVCHDRVIQRNRQGESIPIEYLTNCHKYHEEWLSKPLNIEKSLIKSDCPRILVNPSEDQIRTWLRVLPLV
jgi:deoxycitidine kinase/deoxyguanosine kinase